MDLPRWTVSELITRYELEPSLRDTFVEGSFDKDVISCAYEYCENERRVLYTADAIDVCDDLYEKHQLTKGNKQSLLILSRELSRVNVDKSAKFIVDRDVDHLFGDLESQIGLIWTEYCDMENYFFEETFVRELVVNAGRSKIADWEVFFASFRAVLKDLFCVRAADRELNLRLSYIGLKKLLKKQGSKLDFDLDQYISRLLMKSKQAHRTADMQERVQFWKQHCSGDPRLYCRGHDFIFLMSWCVLKFNGIETFSDEVIERILILLIPREVTRFSNLL